MALGLPTDQRSQIMALVAVVALVGGYFFYTKYHVPTRAAVVANESELDSLQAIIDHARNLVASGEAAALDRRVEQFQATLAVLRRLVPDQQEVAALIDDVSNRAKVRGVELVGLDPLTPESGQPFDIHRVRFHVYGHYDQIGEFLTDIASLERIIVPEELALRPASQQAARQLADTSGALLEALFAVRTFVKSAATAPAAGGGGAQP